jgi:hypothetical protein
MLVKVLQNNVNNDEINKLIQTNTLFVGVFSKNCHYCVSMKPEWLKFKKMAMSNYSNLQGLVLEIDSSIVSSLTNSLITNNVNGFPSLFIIKKNKIIKYNNERTALEFMKFFKLYLHKSLKTNLKKNKHVKKTHKLQKSSIYNPKLLRKSLSKTFRKN